MEWVCVELTVASGGAELWLQGRSAGSVSVGTETATRFFWLGMVERDSATSGAYALDEWAIGDAYVGPERVAPASELASDPARWVVLYDVGSSGSAAWATEYRRRRGVPLANLIGVRGGQEVLDETSYEQVIEEVESYLDRHGLVGQVVGVLVGYGVPGFVRRAVEDVLDPLSAGLTAIGQTDPVNELAEQNVMDRPTVQNMGGLRIVARVDAASLAGTTAMLDRAGAIEAQGPLGVGESEVYLSVGGLAEVAAWAQSANRQRTRLRVEVVEAFESMTDDGVFWGEAEASPPVGFLGDQAGTRVFGLPVHVDGGTGLTLRSTGSASWVGMLFTGGEGYAAMGLSSRESSPAMWPGIERFFEALRRGWTLGEAWFASTRQPGGTVYLVGDPLLHVTLAAGGWDVYGPLSRLEMLDDQSPQVMLGAEERVVELAGELTCEPGDEAIYLVRRVADDEEAEGGIHPARVQRVGDDYVPALVGPVWPVDDQWPVWVEGSSTRIGVWWERPARQALVGEVELWEEVEGTAAAMVDVWRPRGLETGWEAWRGIDGTRRRYRWRMTGRQGQEVWTNWSEWVRLEEADEVVLQLWGQA